MARKLFIYKLCNKIFFPSQFSKDDFKANYKTSAKTQLIVNYNAISDKVNSLENLNLESKVRNQGIIALGFLGRIDPSKGLLEAIKAIKEFSVINPGKIKLHIAGTGKIAKKIENEIKGFSDIEMLGSIPSEKVYSFISSCDFLICPSLIDNLPTVCLESLMLGVPVIGSNRGGIPEIIEDRKEGFLLPGLETGDFINVFTNALSLSSVDYKELSDAARIKFLTRFSMKEYITNMKQQLGITVEI
jgi:glycosyltransferase involved in cell wall biosynthesis